MIVHQGGRTPQLFRQNKFSLCSARPADREAGARTTIAKKNSFANLLKKITLQRFLAYLTQALSFTKEMS